MNPIRRIIVKFSSFLVGQLRFCDSLLSRNIPRRKLYCASAYLDRFSGICQQKTQSVARFINLMYDFVIQCYTILYMIKSMKLDIIKRRHFGSVL